MSTTLLTRRKVLMAIAPALAFPRALLAAESAFPERAVHFVNWSSPGGNLDIVSRLLAEQLGTRWHQAVVTDNKPGASGIIATDYVAKAAGDGYTVLITSSTGQITNALIRLKLPFDVTKDFKPVSLLAAGNIALAAREDAPFSTLAELVTYAKTSGKGLNYGSFGIGTSAHLFGEHLRRLAGIGLTHVPYKGELAGVTDLMSGNLDLTFLSQGNAKIYSDGAKVKLLAISGAKRTSSLPNVPTFAEQGYSGFGTAGWIGAFVPFATPDAIVEKISRDMREVLGVPDTKIRLEGLGYEVIGDTPKQFKDFFQEDFSRVADMVKGAGITRE
jgi:tripartite-type tricarboxylate transporter receptor subunit TctC